MQDIIKTVEKTLENIKDVTVLNMSKKQSILKSVFESRTNTTQTNTTHSTQNIIQTKQAMKKSFAFDMTNFFSSSLKFSLPIVILAIVSTQFIKGAPDAFYALYDSKNDLDSFIKSAEFKSDLAKTKSDISKIKNTDDNLEKEVVAKQLTKRSEEIRNKVAALVDAKKITEAKQIVLTLETALKSEDLYKVATSVQEEINNTIDMRVALELKESSEAVDIKAISSSSTSDLILDIKKRIESIEIYLTATSTKTASTSDFVSEALKHLERSKDHFKKEDFEKSIIALQAVDRIVAEIKQYLLI